MKNTDIEKHFVEDKFSRLDVKAKTSNNEKVRNLEMTIDEIREAKDELVRMSNDSEQRASYEMRSKILKDKVSALNNAKREGKIEIARNLKGLLEDEIIAEKTGLDIETIKNL